jgi:alpha-beta hydrolase superfamily lysophospholipase
MAPVGRVRVRRWPAGNPARLAVLAHGYGQHIGRRAHVAEALAERGSVVVGPHHVGHGSSSGEQALAEDFDLLVGDLRGVVQDARGDLPVVMVGHSMGGLIATRYAQRHREDLAGLGLSGPRSVSARSSRGGRRPRSCRRIRSTWPCCRAIGDLPLLHVHGAEDQLVPAALARPVVERLAGPDSELHVIEGARHEVFNEIGKEETIGLVVRFAARVAGG